MPLTWDFTEVEDSENLATSHRDAGIWASMAVGIFHLTDSDVSEFYTRVSFWERVNGAFRQNDKGEDVRFTCEEVQALVGMRTNASRLTKNQFIKKAYDSHERWNV